MFSINNGDTLSFNVRKTSKNSLDFYPTPPWAVDVLLEYENFDGLILEPACGTGNISNALIAHGFDVISSDINDYGYGEPNKDFFALTSRIDNIITNPPYNIADKFVEHSLKLANKKIALLLRLAFLEGANRYNSIYAKNPPSTVLVFTKRLTFNPELIKGNSGSGHVTYAWFIWDKEKKEAAPVIKWISPDIINQYRDGKKRGRKKRA